jgi:hypothetical protein
MGETNGTTCPFDNVASFKKTYGNNKAEQTVLCFFINQFREKIGVFGNRNYYWML